MDRRVDLQRRGHHFRLLCRFLRLLRLVLLAELAGIEGSALVMPFQLLPSLRKEFF